KDQTSHALVSAEKYGNFDLIVDVRQEKPGEVVLKLRGLEHRVDLTGSPASKKPVWHRIVASVKGNALEVMVDDGAKARFAPLNAEAAPFSLDATVPRDLRMCLRGRTTPTGGR